MAAGARVFLADSDGLASADAIDGRREERFTALRDAFRRFRDGDSSLEQLAAALDGTLDATLDGRVDGDNLWGLDNDDERRFAERLADAAARRRDLDLAAVVRSFLEERPEDDEERTQQLLAFGELVAGLDAGADAGGRLGVGPAACFLTLAWHCLSNGRDPVFSYSATRAIRTLAKAGVLSDPDAGKGELERRFGTFFEVCRMLEPTLRDGPPTLRLGWAIGHTLAWMRYRLRSSAPVPGAAPDEVGAPRRRPRASRSPPHLRRTRRANRPPRPGSSRPAPTRPWRSPRPA